MRNKKANLIRSFLLNKINNEIISNFKKKEQMRINGKKEEELYKINCQNYEICIIHKLTIGISLNKLVKIKNVSTYNLNMIYSLDEIESLDNLKDIKPIYQVKKIISEKKLKIFPQSRIKRNNILFNKQIKKSKLGLLMLRKIVKNLINKTHIIHTIKTIKDENKKLRINRDVKTVFSPKNHLKIKNKEYDFKIKLINMSHRGPSHHYKLDNIETKKNNNKKKLTPSSSQILSKVIKKKINNNKSKRKSIFMKEKLSLSNVLNLNDSNINDDKDNSILTSREGTTKLTLLDYDSS